MKILPLLTMVPALSMAGQISGKVSDLDGRPLAGVEVQGRHESDISKPSGAWTVGAALGRSPAHRDLAPRQTSLVHQQGRLSWATGGRAIDGRSFGSLGGISPPAPRIAAARAFEPETLWVYWNGKRLAQIPLASSDTAGVSVRIDTGWSDDNGIPWNPRIEYGSVRDAREATTYRVVQIGGTKWMAEDLLLDYPSYKPDLPPRLAPFESLELFYTGRMNWVPEGPRSLYVRLKYDSSNVHGYCPEGWRMPNRLDVLELARALGECPEATTEGCIEDSLPRLGHALRARSGWPSTITGDDAFGLRLLPASLFLEADGSLALDSLDPGVSSGFWLSDTWEYREPVAFGPRGGFVFTTGTQGTSTSEINRVRPTSPYWNDYAAIRCVQSANPRSLANP